jgi:zinc transporter, ZIP family
MDIILPYGLIGSLIAGLATGIGAIPILFPIVLNQRFQGILLGLGGGVMLAAATFSLIIPGTAAAIAQGADKTTASLLISSGIICGGLLMAFLHNNFPHEHFFKRKDGPKTENFARIWLFVAAIALHNFPEGLVVALSLRELQYSPRYAFNMSLLTGLVEPIGSLVGVGLASIAQSLLPWTMAFAAGAMLFVIVDEIIPEINHKGLGQQGTLGVMVGFVMMMFMDIALSA